MHFGFNDDQAEIRRAARDLLARRSSIARVRQAAEDRAYDEALWQELLGLGWAGLVIGEEHDGVGLGLVELVAVTEQLGYAITPSPLLSDMCAALVISHAGDDEQRARWLPDIASGAVIATVALAHDSCAVAMPDADRAGVFLFIEGDSARAADAASVTVEPYESIDLTRRYARVSLQRGELLTGDLEGGLQRAEIALAAELTGLAQRALDTTVAYVKDRAQFGRPIGAYQGVSHRCAEMLALTEAARSATYFAAWAADADPSELCRAASIAKASAVDAACRASRMAIQAHGGIGFTWEAGLHWIYKRSLATSAQLESVDIHRRRLARLASRRLREEVVR
jgi:alkylation response protein AidB-like acyl-CoA dehydrogenase